MDFHPPIQSRSTEELLRIASNHEEWQPEARALAQMELERRDVDPHLVQQCKEAVAQAQSTELHRRTENALESYPAQTLVGVFLAAPFMLVLKLFSYKFHLPYKLGLTQLDRENFNKKYRQRMTALIAGTLFWVVVLKAIC